MLKTFEGIIDQKGRLKIFEQIKLSKPHRVIITILNETADDENINLALLSESALARDWNHPEEDEAWSHLAQLPSL